VSAETEALQATLAAEHAATYLFGLLGARTSQTGEPALYDALQAAYVAHRERRDDLVGRLAALGETPVAAATAYTPPAGIDTTDGRFAAAAALESACAATYAAQVGMTTGATRVAAIGYLDDSAARVVGLRGAPEAFPGASDLAP
jgi:hypothetical protein